MINNMDYKKLTKPYEEIMFKNIKDFCAIDSVYDEETVSKENPFGIGVSKALNYIASLAQKDGFKVTNYDNMVVEILCGKGDKNITIMAHADVVPEGEGWDQDPFEVVEKNGVLYARGVADDKGPLLSCYYGLLALKENNLLGDYTVRFLVGGNEERGSLCMHHYFHTLKKEQPTLGFSPDSDYPLIFAEKGIFNFVINKSFTLKNVESFKGGLASNAVIESCLVKLKKEDKKFLSYLDENKIKYQLLNNKEINFIGLSAHGSIPEQGINAGMIAISALADFYKEKELLFIKDHYSDLYGRGVNAYNESVDMGKNSLNVGLVSYNDNTFSMTVNFRHVENVKAEQLMENIKEVNKGFEISFSEPSPLIYFPKDHKLVKTLLEAYQKETGDYKTPVQSTGGGTYAKEADNVIAFGMQFPGWDSKMHSIGEQTTKEALIISMAIYARAIIELGKIL